MRGTAFAALALICSGCLEPRSCLELYTCPPEGDSPDETEDSKGHSDSGEGGARDALDSGASLETVMSGSQFDGSVAPLSGDSDGGGESYADTGLGVCGDGVFDSGEVCDDGNIEDEDACTYGQASCIACNATCNAIIELTGPTCGDDVVTDDEACDEEAGWCQECKIVPVIEAGGAHTCAVLPTGTIRCWGRGTYGQLGSGVASSQNVPVQVGGLSRRAKSVAAGNGHSCALFVDGGVSCWGDGVYGQIGNGEETKQLEPVQVTGLESGVIAIVAAGDHSCALKGNGQVVCWGFGASGQLGNGGTDNHATPVVVEGLEDVTALTAGSVHMCSLLASGTAKCWGYGSSGQLGNGVKESSSAPVAVADLTDVMELTAGAAHTCALLGSGLVKCWGAGSAGQLGNGEADDQLAPASVADLGGRVTMLSAGDYHTCARLEDTTVKCWGVGSSGQLGNGLLDPQPSPVVVAGLQDVGTLTAGASYTCAMLTDGSVDCWGAGTDGQLGNGLDETSPNAVKVLGIE